MLGFSDHAPYLFEDGYVSPIRMKMNELEGYVDSIYALKKEYEKDIEIYCGLEMEYFPRLFERTIDKIDQYPIEYMILGQHFYDDEIGWITPKRTDTDEAHLKKYVDRIVEGIATNRFLYVAHPDLVYYEGERHIYKKHMLRLAQELKKHHMPIEVNMNGFCAGLHYPGLEFMKIGIENGNEFIMGVDAHSPKMLLDYENYENCKQMITQLGGKVINSREYLKC